MSTSPSRTRRTSPGFSIRVTSKGGRENGDIGRNPTLTPETAPRYSRDTDSCSRRLRCGTRWRPTRITAIQRAPRKPGGSGTTSRARPPGKCASTLWRMGEAISHTAKSRRCASGRPRIERSKRLPVTRRAVAAAPTYAAGRRRSSSTGFGGGAAGAGPTAAAGAGGGEAWCLVPPLSASGSATARAIAPATTAIHHRGRRLALWGTGVRASSACARSGSSVRPICAATRASAASRSSSTVATSRSSAPAISSGGQRWRNDRSSSARVDGSRRRRAPRNDPSRNVTLDWVNPAPASGDATRWAGSEELILAGEDLRHGVVGEDPPHRVGEDVGARQHADVVGRAAPQRHRVGDDDPGERRGRERLERVAREDSVGRARVNGGGAFVEDSLGGRGERAAGVDDVVDDHGDLALDVADDVSDLGDLLRRPLLLEERVRRADLLRELARQLHTTGVRGDDDQVRSLAELVLDEL